MPAKSKAQQAYMAIAEHNPAQLRGPMPSMTIGQMADFAKTPTAALPERVAPKAAAKPTSGAFPHRNLGKFLHPAKKGR